MNLAGIIEGHPGEDAALLTESPPLTYGELRGRVEAARAGLVGLGVAPGDRVALVSGNDPLFVVAFLAAVGAGTVVVPLDPGSPGPELQRQLATVGARVAVVGSRGAASLAGVDRTAVPTLEAVVAGDDVALAGAVPLGRLGGPPVPVVDRGPDDLAVLAFTAGTAGVPRAAMLTHGNLLANLDQLQQVPGRRLGRTDVSLAVLPFSHIFGLNVVLGLSLWAGAALAPVDRFDPAHTLATVRSAGVTVVAGAPPVYTAWAALPDVAPDAFAGVRLAVSGASPLPAGVAETMERRHGLVVLEGYGLTEASPVVTSSGGVRRPGSVGRPLPGVEVRLVEADGEEALLGDEGEVWVRGANVFPGYWQDEEATRAALTPDGWLRTGDVALADDDGWLYLVDRLKDLIIVSGFNVHPAEVEEVLLEHPGVAAAGVVGVPHPVTGETVRAVVVAAPGHRLDAEEVIAFVAGRLARYKCPTEVEQVAEVPRGPAGKVLRRSLRAAPGGASPARR